MPAQNQRLPMDVLLVEYRRVFITVSKLTDGDHIDPKDFLDRAEPISFAAWPWAPHATVFHPAPSAYCKVLTVETRLRRGGVAQFVQSAALSRQRLRVRAPSLPPIS